MGKFFSTFAMQVLLKGLTSLVYARLGQSSVAKYMLHILVALWLFLDSNVLMEIFDMPRNWRRTTMFCTLGMLASHSTVCNTWSKWRMWDPQAFALAIHAFELPQFWVGRQLANLGHKQLKLVWMWEFIYQIFENGLITSVALGLHATSSDLRRKLKLRS